MHSHDYLSNLIGIIGHAPFTDAMIDNIMRWQKNSHTNKLLCPEHEDTLLISTQGLKCSVCDFGIQSLHMYILDFDELHEQAIEQGYKK
jgi:hypothetical protein